MGYTTKFNIGDYVWILDTDYPVEKCSYCGATKHGSAKEIARKVKVTDIHIYGNIESYIFPTLPRVCTANNVFATKEEALNSSKK